jgi:RNA polymerase primary sigma factor
MSRARIDMIEKSLEHLPERERRILSMRFGLGQWKEKPHTLEEVAALEGITRERVRQIEQKSLSRLRHPNNKESLRSFIDDE